MSHTHYMKRDECLTLIQSAILTVQELTHLNKAKITPKW
jgi:hypothetical protein